MPGIRKKGKRSFGFYWQESEIALLKTGAESMGLDMSSYVQLLVHAQHEAAVSGVSFETFADGLKAAAEREHVTFNQYVKDLYEVGDKRKGNER